MKTIKVKFASYAKNGGDGSVSVYLYANTDAAEDASAGDDERNDEDVEEHELEIDTETGEIVGGLK
jgi:hypothetical protein